MSYTNREITININTKRLIALSIIGIITLVSVGSYIIALLAFVSPTEELRWEAEVVDFVYYWGSSQSSFNPGDEIVIKGAVIEGDSWGPYAYAFNPISVRWIINVKGPYYEAVYFTSGTNSSADGNFNIPDVRFTLPSDAANGQYTARLMLWTGWLPSGDTRTLHMTELIFTVPVIT